MQQRRAVIRPPAARTIWAGLLVLIMCLPAQAQPGTRRDDLHITGSISGAGINLFMRDRWALVKARVSNPTDQAKFCRVVWSFDNEARRQFVRRIWVPAQSMRELVWPARLGALAPDARSAEGKGLLLSDDAEASYGDEPGSIVVIELEEPTSMLAGDNDPAIQAVEQMRNLQGLARGMNYPVPMQRGGPRYTLGWQPIQIMVLASEHMQVDAAQRRALRRWLRAGGTMWVMLDAVDDKMIEEVLGDDWAIQVVDRVSWNRVRLDTGPDASRQIAQLSGLGDEGPTVESEVPFEMVRVLAPEYDVLLESRGWPVLLRRRVGAGQIIVTTLSPRAWSNIQHGDALFAITSTVYPLGKKIDESQLQEAADRFVESQIGYEIIGRGPVALVLGGYVLLFAVGGIVMLFRKRAVYLAMVGVATAVLTGGVLLFIGYAQRGSEEPTASIFQLVKIESDTVAASVSGTMAMFAPFEREAVLSSKRGGWAWPRERFASGATRRLMWTDLDYWQWQRLTLAGGAIAKIDYATPGEFAAPLRVSAAFNAKGVVVNGSFPIAQPLQDIVLINGDLAMAVTPGADGQLVINGKPLPSGAFIDGAVMTQTQQSRNVIVQAAKRSYHWDEPMLLGWSGLVDDGLSIDQTMQQRGQALWTIPLEFERAEPGQQVSVPRAWLAMQPLRRVRGLGASSMMYDARRKEFIEMSLPGTFGASFSWPKAVAPLDVQRAKLFLDINAPGRTVEILSLTGSKPQVLRTINSPSGPVEFELDPVKLGTTDRELMLAVRVGTVSGASGTGSTSATWRINQLAVEVGGVVAKREPILR